MGKLLKLEASKMTVGQLISLLEQVEDKSQRVIVNGYEGGYCDVKTIVHKMIVLDVNTNWWDGPHEDYDLHALTKKDTRNKVAVDAMLIK